MITDWLTTILALRWCSSSAASCSPPPSPWPGAAGAPLMEDES